MTRAGRGFPVRRLESGKIARTTSPRLVVIVDVHGRVIPIGCAGTETPTQFGRLFVANATGAQVDRALRRQKRYDDAVASLGEATRLNPDNAHYCYVYAVALNSVGQTEQALSVLKQAQEHNPVNQELLLALVNLNRAAGNLSAATTYAKVLTALGPTDTAFENRALLDPERQTIVQVDVEPRHAAWTFPVTEAVYDGLLSLPVYADLTDDEQDRVVATLRTILADLR